MPLTTEEVYRRLIEATEEAKVTIRVLHEARAAANDVIKKQRKELTELIQAEIASKVNELSLDARARMVASVDEIISNIEKDWRSKLGL